LRGLLELGLWNHLKLSGGLSQMEAEAEAAEAKRNQKLRKDWCPDLTPMMKYVVRPDAGVIDDAHLRKALRMFTNDPNSPISIKSLHQIVHNPYHPPTEDGLRNIWTRLEPLLQIILVDPS